MGVLFPICWASKSEKYSSRITIQTSNPNSTTLFIEYNMLQGPLLDQRGNLLPIENKDLEVSSKAEQVNEYARMYNYTLLREARKGVYEFELFMELHRRATQKYLKDGTRYSWDTVSIPGEYQNQNAIMVSKYDRKWKIVQRGGLTYMPQSWVPWEES